MQDPRESCGGSCIRIPDLNAELYPEWASPEVISLSELDGRSKRENEYSVCPLIYDDEPYPCEAGEYWNELACMCFKAASCMMLCPEEDEDLNPLKMCECENKDVIRE